MSLKCWFRKHTPPPDVADMGQFIERQMARTGVRLTRLQYVCGRCGRTLTVPLPWQPIR